METRELLAPDPPHRSEVHYLRLGRLLMISAVIFMMLFAGTSAAILWRIQDQAEQRAQATARGMVEIGRQWLIDQLAVVETLDPAWLVSTADQPGASPYRLVGSDKNWYALRVVSEAGNGIAHFGRDADLPAAFELPGDPSTLNSLAPLRLGEQQNWVVPIVFPISPDGMRLIAFLNQRAFERLFRKIHPDGTGSLSLLSSAGTMLLRYPFPEQLIGKDFSSGPLFSEMLKEEVTGTSWAPKSTDGVLRLVAHHKLNGYPFVMTAGVEAEMILNRARNEIISAAVVLLTVLLFTGVVVAMLIRQFRLAEGSRRALLEAEARLRDLATHDSLTGCLNRRAILVEASEELHRFRRNARPFSLLMIDIDNFKQLNDRFGHLVGDSILVGMASLCRDLLRPTDQIGRYGGEEFLILLPETDAPTASQVANRLRSSVAELPFETGKEQAHITLSIGVAAATPNMQSLKPLIQKADAALYIAKEEGRDRVCVSEELDLHAN